MIHICVRGWKQGVKVFEDKLELRDMDELERVLPAIAQHHIDLVASGPCMIEIEFLDEPDVNQRFFRFGSDPSGMTWPIEIDPGSLPN